MDNVSDSHESGTGVKFRSLLTQDGFKNSFETVSLESLEWPDSSDDEGTKNNDGTIIEDVHLYSDTDGQKEKSYVLGKHPDITLTWACDSVTAGDEEDLRGRMSCGHDVDPNSCTEWCRNILNKGSARLHCPALLGRSSVKCGKPWDYLEVRRVALLNDEEKREFERKISDLCLNQLCDFTECPGCRTFLERKEPRNLRVNCPLCTKRKGKPFDFCWNCVREWRGTKWLDVGTCGREACVHPKYPALRDAPWIQLDDVKLGEKVPSRRACPTCGNIIEHCGKKCKYMECPRCQEVFCFSCLRTKAACHAFRPNSWFKACKGGVAPKQTAIPVWKKAAGH